MQKFYIYLTIFIVVSCSKYDDSILTNRVNNLEERIVKLEKLCQQLNTNITSLQSIVNAITANDCIIDISPIIENGVEIGYKISFSKNEPIIIYHGRKGDKGENGSTPMIGVKQNIDGIYYWTINGEWLTDDAGNKICAQGMDGEDGAPGMPGMDGEDGAPGMPGMDGITPLLKIENEEWYISYDNGITWQKLGKATGEDGDSIFKSVTHDDQFVYFTLVDNTVLVIPLNINLDITFNANDLVVMDPNSSRSISYTITSVSNDVDIEVFSSSDIKAKVVPDDKTNLAGTIQITTGNTIDEYSKVIVLVSNGTRVLMRSFSFEETGLVINSDNTISVLAYGGITKLYFISNVDCKAIIPENASNWISSTPETKAMTYKNISLTIKPNENTERRSTVVTVQALDSQLSLEYIIIQAGRETYENIPPDNEIWYTASEEITPQNNFPQASYNAEKSSYDDNTGRGILYFDNSVTTITYGAFRGLTALTEVTLPTSTKEIGGSAFSGCTNLTKIIIPNSVSILGKYAFYNCSNLRTIEIPNSVYRIEDACFWDTNLESITFKGELLYIGQDVFGVVNNIKEFKGKNTLDSYSLIVADTLVSFATKSEISTYEVPQGIVSIGESAFRGCNLTNVYIPEGITSIKNYAFTETYSLRSVSLPNTLKYIGNFVFNYTGLQTVYCNAIIPPLIEEKTFNAFNSTLKIYVPNESMESYKNAENWSLYADYIYPISDESIYISTDYSSDGIVYTLQSATEGNGIDLVLMGDGYSDRQIADRTYYNKMKETYDILFSIEPYKSFKHLFNVYYINAISSAEGYNTSRVSAFGGGFATSGNRVLPNLNINLVKKYTLKAVNEDRIDNTMAIVLMNSVNYTGICYQEKPNAPGNDWGEGFSVAVISPGPEHAYYNPYIYHEALGHGFAKLADEYTYGNTNVIPESYVNEIKQEQKEYGWWKNIDFTNDPNTVKWSQFLSDKRYANQAIGIYEGGLTYGKGVWRPTSNSIMNDNTGEFNAPSREAIYYRIHKLAYGSSWQYDYEQFVEYDIINR